MWRILLGSLNRRGYKVVFFLSLRVYYISTTKSNKEFWMCFEDVILKKNSYRFDNLIIRNTKKHIWWKLIKSFYYCNDYFNLNDVIIWIHTRIKIFFTSEYIIVFYFGGFFFHHEYFHHPVYYCLLMMIGFFISIFHYFFFFCFTWKRSGIPCIS